MLLRRLGMLLRLILLFLPVATLKVLAISQGWEVLRVTPLFAGLVTCTVFLIGFLFNGVLADYKESEKCPVLPQRGLRGVGGAFLEWFHGTVTTAEHVRIRAGWIAETQNW